MVLNISVGCGGGVICDIRDRYTMFLVLPFCFRQNSEHTHAQICNAFAVGYLAGCHGDQKLFEENIFIRRYKHSLVLPTHQNI